MSVRLATQPDQRGLGCRVQLHDRPVVSQHDVRQPRLHPKTATCW